MLTHNSHSTIRSKTVRNQHPIVYIEAALDDTRSGRYLARKSDSLNGKGLEELRKADSPLESVVADTVELDVSDQGQTLSRLNRQSVKFLSKSVKNQKAAQRSFGSASLTLDEVKDSLSTEHRRDVEEIQKLFGSFQSFEAARQNTTSSYQNLKSESSPHLSAILKDGVGVDVSQSGTQLDSLYDGSKNSLVSANTELSKTDKKLSDVIAILEDIASDIEP